MKGLATLVRMHRWQLDERRRDLANLERLIDQLKAEAERLADDLANEQQVARQSDAANRAYGGFAQQVVVKQRRLATTLAEVEARAAEVHEEVAEAFRELKRHEMTMAARERKAQAEVERKDRVVLDEMGLNVHRRRVAAR
mgnify:FL=1